MPVNKKKVQFVVRNNLEKNFYSGWDARKLFNPNLQRSIAEFGRCMTWLLGLLPLVVDHALLLDGGGGGGHHGEQDHYGHHGGAGARDGPRGAPHYCPTSS